MGTNRCGGVERCVLVGSLGVALALNTSVGKVKFSP